MPHDELVPSEKQIYGWIEEVFAQGIRRPGYPADRSAEQFSLQMFRDFGLENVRLEPVELPGWEPQKSSLVVHSSTGEDVEFSCFALPHSEPTAELEAELVEYDREHPAPLKGRIALYDVRLSRLPNAGLAGRASWCYDPDDSFSSSTQVLPFGPDVQAVMEPSMAAGAVAFVGSLSDYPSDSHDYYVPYDGVARPIPGVWISGSDGARLRHMMLQGPVHARLVAEATRNVITTTHNVVGELPGADEELVIIGSHHDGPWASAVEDGSGIALVLAQAAYWAQVPANERPHGLVFLLNSGHMAGGAGVHAFIGAHADELAKTVLEVHLEHAANECVEQDGQLAPTGHPETRWWFTSRVPELEASVQAAIQAEDLRRSMILPPDIFGPSPTTDGGPFHLEGVPLVNFLTAPFYLFDSLDTLDKIHRPSLVPVTRAAVRIIEATEHMTAESMRVATHA